MIDISEKIEEVVVHKDETKGTHTYESETDIDEEELEQMAEVSSKSKEELRKVLTSDQNKRVRPLYLDKSAFSDPENPPEKFKLTLEEIE